MEHKWLGAGLLAMGVIGLCSLVVVPTGAETPAGPGPAAAGEVVKLPEAPRGGGMGLYGALGLRASARDFSGGTIGPETWSRLLWAACGVNRPDGRWTIPTALNKQDLRVYVLDAAGVWLYDPAEHARVCRRVGDHRAVAGMQPFVADAAANLVYVAAPSGPPGHPMPREAMVRCAAFEAGCAAQDVALVCAAEGLKNVVRASYPEERLRAVLGLADDEIILMAQSVGP